MAQNKHLEHLEDELINYGYGGYVASKDLIENFIAELGGRPTGRVTVTTKWDGAPAVVCGKDPETGNFLLEQSQYSIRKIQKLILLIKILIKIMERFLILRKN